MCSPVLFFCTLMKYFCACERIWITLFVRTCVSICFQLRPNFFSASRKAACSSSVQFSRFLVITYFLRGFLRGPAPGQVSVPPAVAFCFVPAGAPRARGVVGAAGGRAPAGVDPGRVRVGRRRRQQARGRCTRRLEQRERGGRRRRRERRRGGRVGRRSQRGEGGSRVHGQRDVSTWLSDDDGASATLAAVVEASRLQAAHLDPVRFTRLEISWPKRGRQWPLKKSLDFRATDIFQYDVFRRLAAAEWRSIQEFPN